MPFNKSRHWKNINPTQSEKLIEKKKHTMRLPFVPEPLAMEKV